MEEMHNKKWTGSYQRITNVEPGHDDTVTIRYANGDHVRLTRTVLLPRFARPKEVRWLEIQVGADGLHLTVPTDIGPVDIPWDIPRRLTDEAFARHLADMASRQASQIGARLRELRQSRGLTQASDRYGFLPRRSRRTNRPGTFEEGAIGMRDLEMDRCTGARCGAPGEGGHGRFSGAVRAVLVSAGIGGIP